MAGPTDDRVPLLTVAEYAAVVRQTPQAVTRRCRRGGIPGAVQAPGSNRWLIPETSLPAAPARKPDPGETAAARKRRAQADLALMEAIR